MNSNMNKAPASFMPGLEQLSPLLSVALFSGGSAVDVCLSALKAADLIARTTFRVASVPVGMAQRKYSSGNLVLEEAEGAKASRRVRGADRRQRQRKAQPVAVAQQQQQQQQQPLGIGMLFAPSDMTFALQASML
ncbi:hypothetical protein FOA52_010462 [Chlamydomonas sp. UWO 241]|nr:hypothetical protein FOA52_010462 [Chlamydomonas sp. UWO 241]